MNLFFNVRIGHYPHIFYFRAHFSLFKRVLHFQNFPLGINKVFLFYSYLQALFDKIQSSSLNCWNWPVCKAMKGLQTITFPPLCFTVSDQFSLIYLSRQEHIVPKVAYMDHWKTSFDPVSFWTENFALDHLHMHIRNNSCLFSALWWKFVFHGNFVMHCMVCNF